MKNIPHFNRTSLKTKPKEHLIDIIHDLYREMDSVLEALGCIEEDIEKIKEGNAYLVHDNP